ncbi:MAG: FHA domain-containing protein [Desulfuromonadaceae bacterium]
MASPPQMTVQLIHIHGGLKGEIQEFTCDNITVGRLSTCLVKFPPEEPGVSREHASISREGNQYKLTDSSKFGTFLNGKQSQEAYLKDGDVIEFGPGGPKVSFTVEIVAASSVSIATQSQKSPTSVASNQNFQPPRESLVSQRVPLPPAEDAYVNAYSPAGVNNITGQVVVPTNKTSAPLVIQFGPAIKSFSELPVVVGSGGKSDFVIQSPGIFDQHAQFIFFQNSYWIKDLTGQGLIKVNNLFVKEQVQLNPQDKITLNTHGPIFRFLGEGRFVEMETETPAQSDSNRFHDSIAVDTSIKVKDANVLSNLLKGFRK